MMSYRVHAIVLVLLIMDSCSSTLHAGPVATEEPSLASSVSAATPSASPVRDASPTAANASASDTSAPDSVPNSNASSTDATPDQGLITIADCVTRQDSRATAWWATTSPEGTACIFGADPRDEGTHCIPEFEYGSNGWCFTSANMSNWGSCGRNCPLYGPHKVLGDMMDGLSDQLGDLTNQMNSASAEAGALTSAVPTTAPASTAPAALLSSLQTKIASRHQDPIAIPTPHGKEQPNAAANAESAPRAPSVQPIPTAEATDAKVPMAEEKGAPALNATEAIPSATRQDITEATAGARSHICVTRKDPRATAWWATTSPEGSPCIFGVDARDEGSHCIQGTEYGSNGWCFTSAAGSSWGSCADSCPLSGSNRILGAKIDSVAKQLSRISRNVTGQEAASDSNNPVNGSSTGAPVSSKAAPGKTADAKVPVALAQVAGARHAAAISGQSPSFLLSRSINGVISDQENKGVPTDSIVGADAKKPIPVAMTSLRRPNRELQHAAVTRVELKHIADSTSDREAITFPGFMLLQKSSTLRQIGVEVTKDAFQSLDF